MDVTRESPELDVVEESPELDVANEFPEPVEVEVDVAAGAYRNARSR